MDCQPKSDGTSCDDGELLFISWNVAGWASTCAYIRDHYNGLENYLNRLGKPAFFCLQETKVQSRDLGNQSAARHIGAVVDGYRSYWAFNEDKTSGPVRFQGVATWVRNDVVVSGATQHVLGIAEFDKQGRVLMTDHGSFTVINVYAPCVASVADQQRDDTASRSKVRFLEALGRAMEGLRKQGRRVVLCGDLNLTHRALDQKLSRRILWVDSEGSIDMGAARPALGPFPSWREQWRSVSEVSEFLKVPMQSLGHAAECLHMREGPCVPWLRNLVCPEGSAEWADVFAEVHPEAQERFTAWGLQQANLRYKNIGTRIDYIIADRGTFDDSVVKSPSSSLQGSVIPRDGAADVEAVIATSASAAANAGTHFGAWHAAAISGMAQGDGLSLQADNMKLNDTQFSPKPHTGLIYTPPCYSDHIAVSVLFTTRLTTPLPCRSTTDKAGAITNAQHTKQSQPWLVQPSISAFFANTPRRPAGSDTLAENMQKGKPATPDKPTKHQGGAKRANEPCKRRKM